MTASERKTFETFLMETHNRAVKADVAGHDRSADALYSRQYALEELAFVLGYAVIQDLEDVGQLAQRDGYTSLVCGWKSAHLKRVHKCSC